MNDDRYSLARAARRFLLVAVPVALVRALTSDRTFRESLGLAALLGAGAAGGDYARWRLAAGGPVDDGETDAAVEEIDVTPDGAPADD